MVDPIPPGFHALTPYLSVTGMARCLEFCRAAFGAELVERQDGADGAPRHACLQIGDSRVMMGGCPPEGAPGGHRPMPAMLYLYLSDVDAAFARARAAGGEPVQEPTDQVYGDRTAAVRDPCGSVWYLATHVEDVPRDELERRTAGH